MNTFTPVTRSVNTYSFVRLAQETLADGRVLRFRASGFSMRPMIQDGDRVEVRAVDSRNIRRGNVILFLAPEGRLLAHRVIKRFHRNGDLFFVTQGDAVGHADGVIPADCVLGRMISVERHGSRWPVGTPAAPIWLTVLPLWRKAAPSYRWLKRSLLSMVSLLVVLMLLIPGGLPAKAQVSEPPQANTVVLSSTDAQGLVVELNTPEPSFQSQGDCQFIALPGWVSTSEPGQPQMPIKGVMLGVPPQAMPQIRVIDAEVETRQADHAPCFVTSLEQLNTDNPFSIPNLPRVSEGLAITQSQSDAYYPSEVVHAGDLGWLRDQKIYQFRFQPFQYNPALNQLRVYRHVVVRIDFNAASQQTIEPVVSRAASADDEVLYSSLLNEQQARAWRVLPEYTSSPRLFSNTAALLPANRTAYKISVNQDGIYAVSSAQLAQTDSSLLSLDPRGFHLYHLNQEVAVDFTGEADGTLDPEDQLIFYAEKNQSTFSDTNVYWLTWDETPGLRMQSLNAAPQALSPLTVFRYVQRIEQNVSFQSSRPSGPDADRWYWDYLSATSKAISKSYSFNLNHVVTNGTNARVKGIFLGYSANPQHHTRIYLNDTLLEDAFWPSLAEHDFDVSVPSTLLKEGSNTIRIDLPFDAGIKSDAILLNWFEVAYDRAMTADSDRLLFPGGGAGTAGYRVNGFTTDKLSLYEVTSPQAPVKLLNPAITEEAGGYALQFEQTAAIQSHYAVLSNSAMLSPVSVVKDNPSMLHDHAVGADYIMISPAAFIPSLAPLADFYRDRGMRVEIVDVQDIYDEFSGGLFTPQAIHDFLAYTYAQWPAPAPTYVLLMGDGNYDYKDYMGTHEVNYIPPYMADVDPWTGMVATDNRFVTVNGDDYLPDMAVGRLPARSATEASTMINKILAYAQDSSDDAWKKNTLFVTDLPDTDNNFPASSDLIADHLIPNTFQITKDYYKQKSDLTTLRADIINRLNAGQLVVNYTGHASTTSWSSDGLFWTGSLGKLTNANRLAFISSMDCLEGYFVFPSPSGSDYSSLAEQLVRLSTGGAVATFSPTGYGLINEHDMLNQGLYQAIFNDGITRLGPASMQAKLFLAQNKGGYTELFDTFMLFGDPALHLNLPDPSDLDIHLTPVSSPPVYSGQTLSFRADYSNVGARTAKQIRLEMVLPTGLKNLSVISPEPGVQLRPGSSTTWALPDLAPGASASLTFTASIDKDFAGPVDLKAKILTDSLETVMTNNINGMQYQVLPLQKIFIPVIVN